MIWTKHHIKTQRCTTINNDEFSETVNQAVLFNLFNLAKDILGQKVQNNSDIKGHLFMKLVI